MTTLFDIFSSFVTGSFAIFALLQFNINVLRTNNELVYYNISQLNSATSCDILEYDLYKIGYRVSTTNKFTVAQKEEINFYCDLDDDGAVDSVQYVLGDTTSLSFTENPDDKPLYRIVNNGGAELISIVTDFRFSYVDSSGINEIGYGALYHNQPKMNDVKGVKIYAAFESGEEINGVYERAEISMKIFPKNIK